MKKWRCSEGKDALGTNESDVKLLDKDSALPSARGSDWGYGGKPIGLGASSGSF